MIFLLHCSMFAAAAVGCRSAQVLPPDLHARDLVSAQETLDALHLAAAQADEETYFNLFAPNAVFLGTDATERWPLNDFKDFALPYFQGESAWVYTVIERHFDLAPDGGFAWFDERLRNARLGETRGSGAMRKIGGQWKIVQYNLTIPIPNELADEVAQMIREQVAAAKN